MTKVVLTAPAERDLQNINAFVAERDPVQADELIDAILDRCLGLAEMPLRYPLVPRYERAGVRRCLHGSYVIFFRIVDSIVEVLHVLHGARDYEKLLGPPD